MFLTRTEKVFFGLKYLMRTPKPFILLTTLANTNKDKMYFIK